MLNGKQQVEIKILYIVKCIYPLESETFFGF